MSLKEALDWLGAARADPASAQAPTSWADFSPDALVVDGRKDGCVFSTEELQEAFRHDWAMRRLRYGGAGERKYPT